MELNFDIIPQLIGLALGLLIVYLFLYYKIIYSVIDPLFIFIFTTAFASVLVLEIVPETNDIIHFFGCQLMLWIGFKIAYRQANGYALMKNEVLQLYIFKNISILIYVTYVLLFIYVLSNLYIANTKGFALLSTAPTESKVANFTEGYGIFRKINWGVGTFLSVSLIFLYLNTVKNYYLYLLLIVITFTALEGSKGALLRIVFAASLVLYHPAFSYKLKQLKKYKTLLPIAFCAVMGVFFTVLLKENDDSSLAFIALIRRLLYTADSVLFFYKPENIAFFATYTPIDYASHIMNPILGLFRLQPYQEALGNIMVENSLPPGVSLDVLVGPNTPFFIEGRIYFGFWGGIFYSGIVGYCCAQTRLFYFSIVQADAFLFAFAGSFCELAIALISDVNLAITQLFDLCFFVLPIFIVVSFFVNQKLTIHRPLYWTKQTI